MRQYHDNQDWACQGSFINAAVAVPKPIAADWQTDGSFAKGSTLAVLLSLPLWAVVVWVL